MTKNRLWRLVGASFIALVAMVIVGVKNTQAEALPSIELTNSVNNWTVQAGSQITLNARILPADYHTISRMEIRRGDVVLTTCWNQNTCSFSLNAAQGTTYLQGVGYDLDGRIIFSPVMSLQGTAANNNNYYGAPSMSLWANTYEVDPVANSGLSIEARATDNSIIRDMRIYRIEDWKLEATNSCINEPYNCRTAFTPVFSNADAGRTYTYEARATDAEGNTGYSARITIRVRGNIGQNGGYNQMPGIYLDRNTIPEQVNVNSVVNIRAEAWDNEGLDRLSIYVTRQNYIGDGFTSNDSYQFPWKRSCYTTIANLTCTLDINGFGGYEGQNLYVWAEALDKAGQRVVSNIYSMRVGQAAQVVNQKPGVYLDQNTIPSEVKADASLHIRAEAWDHERLSQLSIYATNRNFYAYGYNNGYYDNGTFRRDCYTSGNNLTCTLDINNKLQGYAGQTFDVWAVATDAAGQKTYSKFYTFKVAQKSNVAPTVSVSTNVSEVVENKTVTVYGKATSPSGVWGVEVRALPSWSNEAITRRCIMSNSSVTTGSCNLTVGPFAGHAGQTVKVWTIAWSSENGMGGSSEAKYITIKSNPKPNYAPSLTVTPSQKNVSPNQTVTFRADASDENGIEKIEILVNARLVKTCTGVTTCEYTGGPFPSYAGNSVTYGANAWDKTGKRTWTGYDYITVKREVVRLNARTRVVNSR